MSGCSTRRPRLLSRREPDERGATAVLVALITTLVLLTISAFAIDLGMQRAGARDMQAVADLVALDMGRLIDGRTRAEIEAGDGDKPSASTQLSWSLSNNDDNTVGDTPTIAAFWVEVDEDGDFPEAGGIPVQVAAGEAPNGVVVRAGTDVAFAFAGVTGVPSGDVERSAVATAEESACFSIGSYAARLNTSNSALLNAILGGILGGGINLNAVSYQGLLTADVSLLDIALELGLGSVDELLSSNINAGTLLIAAANVLQADGGVSDVNVLNMVAAQLGGPSINVGDLVSAEPGSGAAETATINVLDLLAGTVLIANGTNAISIPGLTANLPLLGTNLTTSLSLIEKARTRCGRRGGTAETAQVALSIDGSPVSMPSVLGLSVSADTEVALSVASARGTLTDIICGSETPSDPSGEDVQVTSGVAGASIYSRVAVSGTVAGSGALGGLLNGLTSLLGSVVSVQINGTVGLRVSTGDPSTVKTAQIRVPNNPSDWDEPIELGSGDLGINTASVTTVPNPPVLTITAKNILGLNVSLNAGQIAGIITNLTSSLTSQVLNPVVTSVNDTLLSPLFDLLGVSVGGADVWGQRPYCSNPVLVG
ncbi:hypothetical protein D0Z08_05910 [Nocardioides immobilis]|uniref:Uncharacterized protein n=1 Tax=Nocardioides immobilis TaxID=2049295 RepID=A0A417Y570_9ACTN|nr:hypothetical protein [Nocardioides immobilis]RHW27832.1 hypothetical protein D0Z08_05910 [Nocardioides immobilis]